MLGIMCTGREKISENGTKREREREIEREKKERDRDQQVLSVGPWLSKVNFVSSRSRVAHYYQSQQVPGCPDVPTNAVCPRLSTNMINIMRQVSGCPQQSRVVHGSPRLSTVAHGCPRVSQADVRLSGMSQCPRQVLSNKPILSSRKLISKIVHGRI